jgi:hypothetical protein
MSLQITHSMWATRLPKMELGCYTSSQAGIQKWEPMRFLAENSYLCTIKTLNFYLLKFKLKHQKHLTNIPIFFNSFESHTFMLNTVSSKIEIWTFTHKSCNYGYFLPFFSPSHLSHKSWNRSHFILLFSFWIKSWLVSSSSCSKKEKVSS